MFGIYLELRKLSWMVEFTTPYFCHYSRCNVSNTGCLPKRNEQIPLPFVYYLPNLTMRANCTKSLKIKVIFNVCFASISKMCSTILAGDRYNSGDHLWPAGCSSLLQVQPDLGKWTVFIKQSDMLIRDVNVKTILFNLSVICCARVQTKAM